MRGRFKKDFSLKKDKQYKTDIAVVGDYVEYDLNDDGTGSIYKIEERKNYLSRKAPRIKGASYRGERLEQVIASNFDSLFIVSSLFEPIFNNKVVDRFLVVGESAQVDVYVIINKTDLDADNFSDELKNLYEKIGYKVFLTSVKNRKGLDEIKKILHGKKSLFWGQSGVGKSSILNALYTDLDLNTGAISTYNDKGTHTTVTSVMIKVEKDTYIIDTPGVREIAPYGIKKEDLGHHFKEFKEYIWNCKFNTCTHFHEPGCAVVKAVEDGFIDPERYESYLKILETIEEDINF